MSDWMNFGTADQQQDKGGLIPHRTPVKVRLKIRPGGYDDPSQGWTGGWATRKDESGAVYLDAEFTVMGGAYDKRKVWSLIGLHSPKGPQWASMGRAFIRAMLESARGVAADDTSERAMKARQIKGFGDLDGMEFCALVEVEKGQGGYDDKNKIQTVIGLGHKDYRALMAGEASPAPSAPPPTAKAAANLPAWAQ